MSLFLLCRPFRSLSSLRDLTSRVIASVVPILKNGTMLQVISLSIVLHLSNLAGAPASIVSRAQADVVQVYSAIGVPIVWDATGAPPAAGALHVVLLPAETGVLRLTSDTVMGAAARTPQGTGVAYVYYRRVEEQAVRHEVTLAHVLACAMSHELGHLLLAGRGHAPSGLMRACWRRAEFIQADQGLLRFSSAEGADIRSRLDELEALVEDDGGHGAGHQLEEDDRRQQREGPVARHRILHQ